MSKETKDAEVESQRPLWRLRLPHILALVSLVPEMLVTASNGEILQATIMLVVITLNIFALRTIPNTPLRMEIVALIGDSLLAALTGWDYSKQGTVALHIVWYFAAVAFMLAAVITVLRSRHRPKKQVNQGPQ
ncbi:MAG: hypothetical protein AAF483_28285 [Planctomycetota bacterium]